MFKTAEQKKAVQLTTIARQRYNNFSNHVPGSLLDIKFIGAEICIRLQM